jgi:DNA-directed RNA polymerase specialized sigma24 family protein
MEHQRALDMLPGVYGAAFTLWEGGADETAIATALDIDVAAVNPLLRLAASKLGQLLAAPKDHHVSRLTDDDKGEPC